MSYLQNQLKLALADFKIDRKYLREAQANLKTDLAALADLLEVAKHATTPYLKRALREMIDDYRDDVASSREEVRDALLDVVDAQKEIASIEKAMVGTKGGAK